MSEELHRRGGRLGAIVTAVVVAGSAVGVAVWQWRADKEAPLNVSGFDLNEVPAAAPRPSAPAAAPASAPESSLGMIKADAGVRIVGSDENGSAPASSPRPPARSTAAVSAKAPPPVKMPDVMNNPEVQKALREQGQKIPPVSLPGQ